ncbi:MAG: YheU family protein [Gammaproteobacteria bacterium]|nr:YheU family protein [Gammaproteobacteria bacterium]
MTQKVEVPWQKLSDEALAAVIEEFVTREGTEYGARDYSLTEKVAQIRAQLQDGKLGLDYDPGSGSCQLFVKR